MALIAAIFLALAGCSKNAITVDDAYVRAPIPGKAVTAGFMRIHNNGTTEIALTAVRSGASTNIEMHEHRHDNGTMRMREVKAITIEAGDQTTLEPGGYHLMIFGIDSTLNAGDNIALELSFSDGSSQTVNAAIKSLL